MPFHANACVSAGCSLRPGFSTIFNQVIPCVSVDRVPPNRYGVVLGPPSQPAPNSKPSGNVQWSFKDKADSVIRVCCTTGPQHIMQNYADYLDLLFSQTAIRYTQTSSFSGSGWQIALPASPARNDTSQHTEGRHRDDLLAAFSSTSLSACAGPVSMPCHKHAKLLTHQEVKSPFNLYLCFCFWSPFGFGCCLSLQYAGFGLSLHS